MKRILIALGFIFGIAQMEAAQASVAYSFYTEAVWDFGGPPQEFKLSYFTYTTQDFIAAPTTTLASSLSTCGVLFSACESIDFSPHAPVGENFNDQISLNALAFGLEPISIVEDFQAGAFGTAGHYVSTDGVGFLNVGISAVPLPASAPLLGAALLSLAGFGYGLNRWVAPKGKQAADA